MLNELPSLATSSKKQSFSAVEPTKQSNRDEKGKTAMRVEVDQVSSSDQKSRRIPGTTSSIIDEVPVEEMDVPNN